MYCSSTKNGLRYRLLAALILLGVVNTAAAEMGPTENLFALSLDELMQLEINTASIQPATQREQPGIITVVTREDMIAAGSRTLEDVLLLVPGMAIGLDVFNVTGLVFRGSWAYEGKVLFLIDDMPVNDLLFGTYAMPAEFPAAWLDRVEVLRGPGGARYGDNAQLAVIRIYTRNRTLHEGFTRVDVAAQREGTPLRQLTAGQQWPLKQGQVSLLASAARGSWGEGTWTNGIGTTTIDTSEMDQQSAQLAVNIENNGSRLQAYYEQQAFDSPQRYGDDAVVDQRQRFRHFNLRVEHEFNLSSQTRLIPSWSYRNENTWYGRSQRLPSQYEIPAQRHALELEIQHELTKQVTLRSGAQAYTAHARAEKRFEAGQSLSAQTYFDGKQSVSDHGVSIYAESDIAWRPYNVSIGVRHSEHSDFGNATAPRLAITRAEDKWHTKFVFDSAYRVPQFETANTSAEKLEPELTATWEVEAGHRIGVSQYITASLFHYRIQDAIIFGVAPNGTPGYINAPSFQSSGMEWQWRMQLNAWRVDANYQYSYTDDDAISLYAVDNEDGKTLGAPQHVFNLWLGWQATPTWSLHPRLRYQGTRHAFVYNPTTGLAPAKLDAELTLDFSARYQRGPWSFIMGLRHLSNDERLIAQPYKGGTPAWPAGGEEAWLALAYEL